MTGTAHKLPASLLDDSPTMVISDIVRFSDQAILMSNRREKFFVADGSNIGEGAGNILSRVHAIRDMGIYQGSPVKIGVVKSRRVLAHCDT